MIRKFKKNKMYHVKWLDHSSCYSHGWGTLEDMNDDDLPCETVGFFVKETKTSIYLALSKYTENNTYNSLMQVLKSCITYSKEVK